MNRPVLAIHVSISGVRDLEGRGGEGRKERGGGRGRGRGRGGGGGGSKGKENIIKMAMRFT